MATTEKQLFGGVTLPEYRVADCRITRAFLRVDAFRALRASRWSTTTRLA
jgi:hypothetical protein